MGRITVRRGIRAGRVEIEGLEDILIGMQSLGRVARVELRKGMREAATVVADRAREELRANDVTGKTYIVKGKEHIASAPGEYPAQLTRKLSKSIKIHIAKSGLAARILTADPKAHIQEYGSINQAARPFLRPALSWAKAKVLRILQDAYQRGLIVALKRG